MTRRRSARCARPCWRCRGTRSTGRRTVGRDWPGGGAAARAAAVDVVLLDLRLPDRDGISVLKELKAALPEVRVLILTAYPTSESAIEALRHGADDFLLKPFRSEEGLHAVRRACAARGGG